MYIYETADTTPSNIFVKWYIYVYSKLILVLVGIMCVNIIYTHRFEKYQYFIAILTSLNNLLYTVHTWHYLLECNVRVLSIESYM